MNSWFNNPMKAYARLEFSKDEDVEFFICQNMLSMPQLIFGGYHDYTVGHYKESNTISIYDITEEDRDLLINNINEYAKKMRGQGIDTIGKIKEAFNRF